MWAGQGPISPRAPWHPEEVRNLMAGLTAEGCPGPLTPGKSFPPRSPSPVGRTWIFPSSPVLSMRLATLTVLPQMSY